MTLVSINAAAWPHGLLAVGYDGVPSQHHGLRRSHMGLKQCVRRHAPRVLPIRWGARLSHIQIQTQCQDVVGLREDVVWVAVVAAAAAGMPGVTGRRTRSWERRGALPNRYVLRRQDRIGESSQPDRNIACQPRGLLCVL